MSQAERRDAAAAAMGAVTTAKPAGPAPRPPETEQRQTWTAAKRTVDVLLALFLLVAVLPLLLVVAVLIRLDSPGPVLFRQTRCGRHRRPFAVLKFRTMSDGALPAVHRQYIAQLPHHGPARSELQKLTGDARVTRVGSFLRRSSLDELPQLINVLRGDMSLVGPRPAPDYELAYYDPEHYARFDVRPGLTGLWQVSGRSGLGFKEVLALDAEYARASGPLLDARILARTPLEILRGRAS